MISREEKRKRGQLRERDKEKGTDVLDLTNDENVEYLDFENDRERIIEEIKTFVSKEIKNLKQVDMIELTRLSDLIFMYNELMKHINTNGVMVFNNYKKTYEVSPAILTIKQLGREISKISDSFGLSPKARSKFVVSSSQSASTPKNPMKGIPTGM